MAYTHRWAVQKYERGRWISIRSFATKAAAETWLDAFGTPDMRVILIAV